jgi:tetratricopeptide (TPR) repeat protein
LQTGETDLSALLALGEIYEGLREYADALDMYEKALPLDNDKTTARKRIESVKSIIDNSGGMAGYRKTKIGSTQTGKGSGKVIFRILSSVACVGGITLGWILNDQIKDPYEKYQQSQNAAEINDLHSSIEQKSLFRNILYGVAGISGIGFGLTFFF